MDSIELIASKVRLEIRRELSRRDMYVFELMEAVGMDGKTATHHLDTLASAVVVESYSEGAPPVLLARQRGPTRNIPVDEPTVRGAFSDRRRS